MYETNAVSHYNNLTATGVQQESDVSRISRLTSNLQKTIVAHVELANLLEQRLHCVLSPNSPTAESSSPQPPKPVVSPLANDLETFEAQLHELSNRYNNILNRLEI